MFYDCDIVFILLEKYFLFAEYYQFTLLYTTRIRFVGFDNGNYVFLHLNFTIKVCIISIYILCWPKVNFLYLLCYKMAKDLKNVFGACLQDYLFVCLFGVYLLTREFFTHMDTSMETETSPLPVKGCKF